MIREFYAIRHKPSDGFLPEVSGTRGGYTHTIPSTFLPPRLFVNAAAGKRALTWWLKGITSVVRYNDSWSGEYDETWQLEKMPERKAEDMEVIPVLLKT